MGIGALRSSILVLLASSAAAFLPPASQKYFTSSARTPNMVCVRRGIMSTHMMAKGRSSRSGSAGEQKRRGIAERTLRVTMDEMHEGMELEGIVRSVKEYGAFIDVGEGFLSCVGVECVFAPRLVFVVACCCIPLVGALNAS